LAVWPTRKAVYACRFRSDTDVKVKVVQWLWQQA
jgi:hypothetical protein